MCFWYWVVIHNLSIGSSISKPSGTCQQYTCIYIHNVYMYMCVANIFPNLRRNIWNWKWTHQPCHVASRSGDEAQGNEPVSEVYIYIYILVYTCTMNIISLMGCVYVHVHMYVHLYLGMTCNFMCHCAWMHAIWSRPHTSRTCTCTCVLLLCGQYPCSY